jgi:2-succinyl-5-enolpyruvyl-6-hydroxy-3-cyclohexene-1-carboxylate synthase
MSSAASLARATICQLIELGVQDFVLSPGSRNAPLSIALVEAEERGLIELHIKVDERGAAFYALGIAKATNQYVAAICTSGTAAANYFPAALEAYHSDNKLLLITADRPARLRKTGANQTTDQVAMYQSVASHDMHEQLDLSLVLTGGPVQLNMQFDEPLLGEDTSDWLAGIKPAKAVEPYLTAKKLTATGNGLIVVGHDKANLDLAALNSWIADSGLPVISEDPLTVPSALAHAAIYLADETIRTALIPDYLIVIGRTTLSRSINALIAQVPTLYIVDSRAPKIDPARSAAAIYSLLPTLDISAIDPAWGDRWLSATQSAAAEIALAGEWSEELALRTITHSLPEGAALFVGSSRPIRDIEGFATARGGITTFANRGLAGIDGNTSTIFGIATQFQRSYAVLGDITFIHDLSALIAPPTADLTIFLIDNNGGGIFSTLPQAGVKGFEKIFGTPHNADLARIIAGFGIATTTVKSVGDLEREVTHPHKGLRIVLVEVPARDEMAPHLKELYQRVSSAVRIGANLA